MLGLNPAEACSAGREGTEQNCSWLGEPPGPPQIELQPVPGVSQGCAWGREGTHQGLFTEAGCGTAWLLKCPPPSPTPACLPELSQGHSMAWVVDLLRHGSRVERGYALSTGVHSGGWAVSATAKWPTLGKAGKRTQSTTSPVGGALTACHCVPAVPLPVQRLRR